MSLKEIAKHSTIVFISVPEYGYVASNNKAFKLNSFLVLQKERGRERISGLLKISFIGKNNGHRLSWSGCRTEFTLFHLRNLIIVIMGLWPLGVHPGILGMSLNDFYMNCNNKEEEKTTTHLFGHWPALGNLRRILGYPQFDDKTCIVKSKSIWKDIHTSRKVWEMPTKNCKYTTE